MPSLEAQSAITPVVLTLDEEPNLRRTLDALTWARRVVVLDSGSTDGTHGIARAYPNVEVFVRPFDDHARQTRYAIHETGIDSEYVLFLDADMTPTQGFFQEVERVFLPGGYDAGLVSFDYAYRGRKLLGSVYPAQLRLFRPRGVEIRQAGHTQTFHASGRQYRFRSRLIHDDQKPLARWVRSQLGYAKIEARRLREGAGLRLKDRLRRRGLLAPIVFGVSYLTAGGPLKGKAALRYAYERGVYEGLLSLRLLRGDDEASEAAPPSAPEGQ